VADNNLVEVMAALKQITSLPRTLAIITSMSRSCFQYTFRKTYMNNPSKSVFNKKPVWLKTADEAIEQAQLDSGN
jgi:hypothetical protein